MSDTVTRLRDALRGTEYEGNVFLVGGVPRDEYLGLPLAEDIDLVLEGDALALAQLLYESGLSRHRPVTFERFGTAKIEVEDGNVEIVSARSESYDPTSRKPTVKPATLMDDVLRRDFTINTLLQNLHSGETLDLTGKAISDLDRGIVRTPRAPDETFFDDPLRMLRAIRFAARFGFEIDKETWDSISRECSRLRITGPEPPVVSAERIRDEFLKIVMADDAPMLQLKIAGDSKREQGAVRGLELLRESGLLAQFLPELLEMVGVTQNEWHLHDVWTHTMVAMMNVLPTMNLAARLALLFHDVGKPRTRTVDQRGVHFYEHQSVGAEMTREALRRLKLTNDQIDEVGMLVELHMRLGEYRPEWSDSAVKRLIRATARNRDSLFQITECDMAAMNPDVPKTDLTALRVRMDTLQAAQDVVHLSSPLNGAEIMETLGIAPGPVIAEAKDYLLNQVIDGSLSPNDSDAARRSLIAWHAARFRT